MSSGEVTLKSSDGVEILVPRSVASLSPTLAARIGKMQKGGGGTSTEEEAPVVHVHEVDGKTLDNVVTYLNVEAGAADNEDAMKTFEKEFLAADTELDLLLDLVLGANSLQTGGLVDVVSGMIAARIKDKSVDWVRKVFEIPNDIPAAEVAAYMAEFGWAFEGVEQDRSMIDDELAAGS